MTGIDILDIDKKIRLEFEKKKEELPILENRLSALESALEKSSLQENLDRPIHEKLNREKIILTESVESCKYDYELNLYIIDTEKILEEYVNVLKIPQKVSFLGKKNVNTEKQTEIINKFISKAKKYITYLNFNINIEGDDKPPKNRGSRDTDICKNCSSKKFNIFENDMACISCGYIQEISWLDDCHSEVDRVSISCNYLYDRKNGFRDIIYRYQGKQNCTIPDDLLKYLENECVKSGLVDPIDQNPQKLGKSGGQSKKERFANVSRYNIIVFLDNNSEYSSFKKHVFHIHWKLTGQPRNNISHLEEKIIQDFVIYVNTFFHDQSVSEKMIEKPPKGKKSLVKKQFLFYQLLMKYDHPCSIEDFFIIRSIDRVIEQENSCQETFQKLDWNYTSIY